MDNQMDVDFEFTTEILDKNEEIIPIELGGGLISYRKYLWAVKFLEQKLLKLQEYKQQVSQDIDKAIEQKEKAISRIKSEVERAMLADKAVDTTPAGGKTLSLPDIASVSISKLQDKIDIIDPETVLDELGHEFAKRVKPSLDTTKAKKYILESGKLPNGAVQKQERVISIRFKK